MKQLVEKFNKQQAVIAVVGLGYVGLPLLLRYSSIGFKVIGFDVDSAKVSDLNNGNSYIEHISSEAVAEAVQSGFEVHKAGVCSQHTIRVVNHDTIQVKSKKLGAVSYRALPNIFEQTTYITKRHAVVSRGLDGLGDYESFINLYLANFYQ